MGEQLIISISREYGSGGHEIARKLADRLELAFYDRCMLDEIAEQMNADVSDFHKYDEKPGNRLLSRRVITPILMKRLLPSSSLIISVRKLRTENHL